MRTPNTLVLTFAAAVAMSTIGTAQETIDGSPAAIRMVVSGKVCSGDDVLTFGESAPGTAGTFERTGRPVGSYSVGYGTILIHRRDQDLHGHVTSVSPQDGVLYMSTSVYRCRN
jgi:hypothetical protein